MGGGCQESLSGSIIKQTLDLKNIHLDLKYLFKLWSSGVKTKAFQQKVEYVIFRTLSDDHVTNDLLMQFEQT